MTKRTIFCASLLILATALGATSAQAQTEASTPLANTPSVKGSGTPGQIPKWLDSRTIGNSVMTELNGNIGIGTTTPGSKLTVEGAADGGFILRVTSTEAGGGVFAGGVDNSSGFDGGSDSDAGGEGVIASGGSSSGLGGDGVNAFGGAGSIGGNGVTAGGSISRNGPAASACLPVAVTAATAASAWVPSAASASVLAIGAAMAYLGTAEGD